jgi:hypothetical protein
VVARVKERRKEFRRRAAVDVALTLADLNAGWGDYDRALEHLRAANEISGGSLDPRTETRRDEWLEEARPAS